MDRTAVGQQLRLTVDKWDFMKLKVFNTTKEIISRMKSKPREWVEIIVSYTYDRGLISRLYRELNNERDKPNKDPFKK